MSHEGNTVIFERSHPPREVPDDRKKANIMPIFSLPSVLYKLMEQVFLETMPRPIKNKKETYNSCQEFTRYGQTLLPSVMQ